jgi:endonuclease/exonuclease/phosphatase family metal-dependent hydrolase
MRVVTLNCWGGRLFDPLITLLAQLGDSVDIFCLQEVPLGEHPVANIFGARDNLFREIAKILPNHVGFKHSSGSTSYCGEPMRYDTEVGQAIFARTSMRSMPMSPLLLYQKDTEHARSPQLRVTGHLQAVSVMASGQKIVVANVHGIWQKVGKIDTPERNEQSSRICGFLLAQKSPVILAGDFNLSLRQWSTRMIEQHATNLIDIFRISTTRTQHYKPATDTKDPHADYIFTRRGARLNLNVSDCRVLPEVVSDHAAVLAEMEIE